MDKDFVNPLKRAVVVKYPKPKGLQQIQVDAAEEVMARLLLIKAEEHKVESALGPNKLR